MTLLFYIGWIINKDKDLSDLVLGLLLFCIIDSIIVIGIYSLIK